MPFPVDIKYIYETERELGVQFPERFKTKMIEENGGTLTTEENEDDSWELFPFFDKSDKKKLSRTANHIVLETKKMREWNNFPNHGVAIASDGGGNRLILIPDEKNPTKLKENIYLWLHETGEVIEVASSIDDFN